MKLFGAAKRSMVLLAKMKALFGRRTLIVAGVAALLGGCAVIPDDGIPDSSASIPDTAPVETAPITTPSDLPTDTERHRVALLLPVTGDTAAVGQSIANATMMALIDANASDLRITTYDTATGAAAAARQAIADGNRLILGPLLAQDAAAVRAISQPAGVPAIAFSNDTSIASANMLVMGHIPEQSIERSVAYARAKGRRNFAALLPEGDYGDRSSAALARAIELHGGTMAAFERYSRGNTSIISAAQRLRTKGGYDTVLIADSARLAVQGADELAKGSNSLQLLGTELWSGEAALNRSPVMNGAIFSSVSDKRFQRFSDSFETRFGAKPYRISTLGYDSVLLVLRISRDWRVGDRFPAARLFDPGGFLGVDGPFRFASNGVVERALEVREVQGNRIVEVEAAPTGFGN
jgi:ABC-type branched-subunit amino acid transport system substrate-binding protein